ncbi:hypothetical protein P691DRAFT_809016 [Macrolepiota fuliginosa MF-IS2]|uniref:OTU domain-containing protein n=1 Tax=Macrolepiota fuliginosa MF-IS2 TaxID=1400762 RepID=A0A9P5XGJ1_9AGAR|nr:hypothetical protein P691DRAFT_809016 [Macrolepiota fuliginosa MF-IS2]
MGHGKRKANPQLKARTTRSSRGRLLSLSDPAQTSQLLNDQLRHLGLYAANTIGDGNCLFRALSDQLHGTDSKHAQLRQHICDWIQKHKARYEPFVEDERGIDTHLRCMRENATYGGHMELSAFAHMARKNVKVVQPGLVYVIEWQAFASSPTSDTKPPPFPDKEEDDDQLYHQEDDTEDVDSSTIYVAYHDWEHFSSIRNLKGPHVGLPRVEERPAPAADAGPSPVAEDYKPAKERKKAEKERERERKERKRETARGKAKYNPPAKGKGKQKASPAAESTDSAEDEDEMEDVEEEDPDPEPVEPEKLKIKLKLTLNSNPSSANISESESTTRSNSTPQRTGLKLRLPPSRSLSVTPSNISTPPTSQASTTSSTSVSSTATLPNTSAPAPTLSHASSSTSSTTETAIFTQALPHAHPPTHTSAPHLTSDSHYTSDSTSGASLSGTTSNRTNRSPKRTFDESEIEDVNSGNGRVKARSRLSGPDRGGVETDASVVGGGEAVVDPERENLSEEQEVMQTLAVASTNRSPSPKHDDAVGEEDSQDKEREEGYESDSLSTSSSSLTKDEGVEPEESGTPTTSLSNSPASSSHQIPTSSGVDAHTIAPHEPSHQQHDSPTTPIAASTNRSKLPTKSQPPNLPGKAALARKQKREVALGTAAATAVGAGVGEDRRLTRRQRKTLGLPKVRKMAAPYDRRSANSGAKGGAGKEEREEEGGEWKRNGTGRVDVRGFRELRI